MGTPEGSLQMTACESVESIGGGRLTRHISGTDLATRPSQGKGRAARPVR
jgi:hypothetical protein